MRSKKQGPLRLRLRVANRATQIFRPKKGRGSYLRQAVKQQARRMQQTQEERD